MTGPKPTPEGILDGMVAQALGRKRTTMTVTSGKAAPVAAPVAAPAGPTLSGSVEQAQGVTAQAAEAMYEQARILRVMADDLDAAAEHLKYGMSLVFSEYNATPQAKPLDVEALRRKAEAEADAKHFMKENIGTKLAPHQEGVAQLFKPAPEIVHLAPDDGWECPDHGMAVVRTSKKTGREFRACPVEGCPEIERR